MLMSTRPRGAPAAPFPCLSWPWGCSCTTPAPRTPKVNRPWLLIGFAHANYNHFCLN